jgi:hypothetical protein
MHDTCKYIQDTYKYIHIHSNTYTSNARVMYTNVRGIFSVDMAYMQIRTNTCIYVQIQRHTFRYIHIHSNLNMYNRTLAWPLGHGPGLGRPGARGRAYNALSSRQRRERDSQARVQVGQHVPGPVDKGQPVSQSP